MYNICIHIHIYIYIHTYCNPPFHPCPFSNMTNPWEAANDRLKEYPNNVDEYVELGAPGDNVTSRKAPRGKKSLVNVWQMFVRGSQDQMFWNGSWEISVKTATSLANPSSVNDAPMGPDSERIIPSKA